MSLSAVLRTVDAQQDICQILFPASRTDNIQDNCSVHCLPSLLHPHTQRIYTEPSDMHKSLDARASVGYLLVSPSSQLPDVGMEGHVLHRRLQVVQIVLIKWLSTIYRK